MTATQDLRIVSMDTITPPKFLRAELPLSAAGADTVAATRAELVDILRGRDHRRLAIVGPCSIHDVDAAREYADWLDGMRARYADDLLVIMRCYFEKPRTTAGWK
ncbi:MAG: 3-deoxy-7-phosphoheptulonate synthase, partial [Planctomycetota bacterium]